MFSVINIHKPLHLTSHDVIARLRKVYKLKRIGHLGTLDPLAKGVLPVCLGTATRLIEYFPSNKRYSATITLGKTTSTLDAAGEETSSFDCSTLELDTTIIEQVLTHYRGTFSQVVPLYSAVHVNGKKLYQLAYAGKSAELPSREVTIDQLHLIQFDLSDRSKPKLLLDISCSSGTYIRSLARDIGEQLGTGAHLSGLIRTQHGSFQLKDATPLQTIQDAENPEFFLQDPLSSVGLPIIQLPQEITLKLQNGLKIRIEEIKDFHLPETYSNSQSQAVFIASSPTHPIGVIQYSDAYLKPIKIFPQS
jgi:tRNA pseudouridine55 synthase